VLPDLYVEVVRPCASLAMVGLGHIAFDGTVSLAGKYSKLIEEAVLGHREKQLTLVAAKV